MKIQKKKKGSKIKLNMEGIIHAKEATEIMYF